MIPRILEVEAMDTAEEAAAYDAMDHSAVNAKFAADFFSACPTDGPILDVGTGTAQIPIELCRQRPTLRLVVAVDLAEHMLARARANVAAERLQDRITLVQVNARGMHYLNDDFPAVVSNSIVHHIPDPFPALAEMVRVCGRRGTVFIRDLLRPDSIEELERLVALYAGNDTPYQRQLFSDSLHAALTLAEVRDLVGRLGFTPDTVTLTSDRHWTFVGTKP
jgi:ubiquinone/menaquinone biosynthesis C-methylase UbiE